MKNLSVLLRFCLVFLVLISCKESEEDRRQKAIELMTTQTLGLAYLEELKLVEAEGEFQKYINLSPEDKVGYANLGLVYLRMGKYEEAQGQLEKAHSMDTQDPDISLLLATVYRLQGERTKSIELLEQTLKDSPDHPKVLFDLCELYSTESDEESITKRLDYLSRLAINTPGNMVPMILLVEAYIKSDEADKALEELEKLPAQFPEFPEESIQYYDQTVTMLQSGDTDKALRTFTIFHNFQKITYPYQAGMVKFKGPGESSLGVPLITYSQQSPVQGGTDGSILDVIKFTEVAASAGLNGFPDHVEGIVNGANPLHQTAGDFDGDGDVDLYVGAYDASTKNFKSYLFQNELGRYKEVSKSFGIDHKITESAGIFADYDNDGFLDLYILGEDGAALYLNAERGQFEKVSAEAGLQASKGTRPVFVDLDHDGDLDIFQVGNGLDQVFRNNGDKTFSEQSDKMGLAGGAGSIGKETVFGDFDDDGDLDLLVLNEDSGLTLYFNERQSKFIDGTAESGLADLAGTSALATGDFNNDGFLDLVIGRSGSTSVELFENSGKGVFKELKNSLDPVDGFQSTHTNDLAFLDFDNDGKLDILVAGNTDSKDGRGNYLFHNDGNGKFSDLSRILPDQPRSANQISLFDYNEDGDTDIVLSGTQGGIFLLRNDGGNMNHYLNMKLVGLRTGSAKNNYYGIGAKVEMRAGDLYQSMVVSRPEISFGLGDRSKADVIRITWTNGVPQNILLPDADQALVEEQTLKGSCPFLYTWNGKEYEFVKDITWRSALGMPLGIMGENTLYAFPDASDDYLKIPSEKLKSKDGMYSIQITSELWETIYMDRIRLVAVDHPVSVDVFVPEQFGPPPFPGMDLYQAGDKFYPSLAQTETGQNVRSLLMSKDNKYVSQFKKGRYQGLTELHDLIIDPGKEADLDNLILYLNGWIFPTDASINAAMAQSDSDKLVPPRVQVIDENGDWVTVIPQLGFPMGKDKTVIADLSGKINSTDRRIRIQTNMEIYWDEAFFSSRETESQLVTTFLEPVSADLHYRGFSKSYRKGGRYGPHWFDYSEVSKEQKWRDLTGNYTRYGEVLELLTGIDNQYVISNAGDEISISFEEKSLPRLKEGWKRDFLIHSVGWVKDGDMNTAAGSTVKPLPYHGMKSYPPGNEDKYPNGKVLEAYQKKYNTREVGQEEASLVLHE